MAETQNQNKHSDDLFIKCVNYFHHGGQKAKNLRPYIYVARAAMLKHFIH